MLEIKNLSYKYSEGTPFEKTALRNISLKINKGEFIGIIGKTGSGKSTLIQHLNGLIRPTCGHVLLDGVDIWHTPKEIKKVRARVGLVFQYPEHQLFEESVYQDIAFGPKNMGKSRQEVDKLVRLSLAFVGLSPSTLEKSPFDLSGGEKRRVAIAGVLAMDPDVLILDEPTAGLDAKTKEELLSRIALYHKEKNNTILFVSHSMEDVARFSDRILVMDRGEVKFFDVPEKIFSMADELEKIGLSLPEISQVMLNLKKRGFDVNSSVFTVNDAAREIARLLKDLEAAND